MARAWVAALLLALPGVRADATDASAEAAANAAGVSTDVLASTLVTTLQNNLAVGEKRLIVMEGLPTFAESAVPKICTGTPAIVSHTPQNGPNGACFAGTAWEGTLQSNLSCTCLTYLSTTEWTFRIKNSASLVSKTEEKLPEKQPLDTEIEVDSTMIYGLSPTLKNLTILGVGMSRVPIKLMPSPVVATSDTVGLIISASRATVSTVHVENLDFGITSIGKGFVPSILTNLTLKNCNIKSFSTDLLTTSPSLVSLDLSSNALSGVFQDVTSTACASNGCDLQTLNLSSNHIKDFPTYLFNLPQLTSLSLLNNSLTNVSVDSSLYAKMSSGLQILELDTPVTCSQDEVMRAVASSKVCVLNATTQSTAAPAASQSGSSSTNVLIYGVIGGCLVIAVLVFVLVKKNSCRSQEQPDFGKEPLDAYFDNTLSYDDTHPTVSASLLNDPIIITNRIPYNDLRVANCISKGGFGLVYSGVYNRRRVAIKKIRPDRAGDIKMIEAFLKEICLMATLNHPRIVEFVGVSWDSLRNLCAVTEFMERGDLREVLHGFKLRNSPLTWDSHKTTIALHIAEGLTYLHSLSPKVIHRDLKSKNVLLNGEMEAKLSDFGISRERHLEETHMTAGIGTSFWIAPEVLLGKDYDERADIFSFGVVLSEIDTDDYPYWNASNPNVGNKAQENMILQMVASGAMRPSFSESCPKAVLELADLCLQVDPENRPTAAEVAYKLQQIVQFMKVPSGGGRSI